MEFKIGETYHILIPNLRMELYKIHIRDIVDNDYIVYKWYGKHKQWWYYEVCHCNILQMKIDQAKEFKKKLDKSAKV